MPLIRRMPKRGFNNTAFTTRYIPVNVESLDQFDNGATVDEAALRKTGLANGKLTLIKVLGTGEVKKKLTVSAHAFSASAKAAIEKAGGTCNVITKPKAEATTKAAAKSAK